MSLARGDVVLIAFPQAAGGPSKRRPAVVVQADFNNGRLRNSIFAMVSGNTRLALREPAQVFIDITTPEGRQTGLSKDSAVKCENLYTLSQSSVVRTIGRLSDSPLQQVDAALRSSLGL